MKIIGILLIIMGILSGLLGVRSYLRDEAYAKASVVVKASVTSAEVKPMSGKAVGSIRLMLSYMRDGAMENLEHNFSKAYSNSDPLPTVRELKAATLYIRYVPKEKRSKDIPDWVMVSNKDKHYGSYGESAFGWMIKFLILGIFLIVYSRVRKKNRQALPLRK